MSPLNSGDAPQPNTQTKPESPELLRLREYLKSTAANDSISPSSISGHETRVVVTDINIPLAAMCRFMVKWSIAAIPALLILYVLGLILGGIAGAIRAIS